MTKLLPVFILCMIFAILSEKNSIPNKDGVGYRYQEKIFYSMIVILMIFFAGLRIKYNDTDIYITFYKQLVVSGYKISWVIGDNPAFSMVNLILKRFGISPNGFIMFYSSITVGIYLWFVRKYSNNFILSLFILFTGGAYLFSFAAIKQCMAIAIGLVGIDALIEKKWGKYVICILIATLFHSYALLFFVAPFLSFKVWNLKSYFLIIITVICGIGFQSLLGTVLSITSLIGENYDINVLSNGGVNIFRILVTMAPVILSFVVQQGMRHNDNRVENIMMNLTMINAALMFIAFFGSAVYLGRVANYFGIFSVISIPYLLKYFTKNSQTLLKILIVLGYLGYFIYAEGSVGGGFDNLYNRISVFQFFSTLFSG